MMELEEWQLANKLVFYLGGSKEEKAPRLLTISDSYEQDCAAIKICVQLAKTQPVCLASIAEPRS